MNQATQPPKTTEEQLRQITMGLILEVSPPGTWHEDTHHPVPHLTQDEAIKQLKDLLVAERLDELDKQAAVTSGITDPAMCMKLLAERHLMRIQELGAIHQTAKAGRRTT